MNSKCKECHIEFKSSPSENKVFCSMGCYAKYQSKNPNKTSFKNGHSGQVGVENYAWKGEDAGYQRKHAWARRWFGQPMLCEGCGSECEKKYDWANISGGYRRTRTDWVRLCSSCHRKYDKSADKMWITRRSINYGSSLN